MIPCKCGNPTCNYDDAPVWGADNFEDFFVRTTESVVKDVADHRKMLDQRVNRLRTQLVEAEAELRQFKHAVEHATFGDVNE